LAKFTARIELELESRKTAEAVAKSVTPDNVKTPKGLTVRTKASGRKVVSVVECDKKFETFFSTLDDLLSCLQVAEKTLGVV